MNRVMQTAVGMGLATILWVWYPRVGLSQTPTPAPAVHDGQHDFDFNLGVWHTHITRMLDPFVNSSDSVELNGTVTVRTVWDGKAELEEIEADGPKGHWEGLTLFLYNPSARQWSQSFANSKAGILTSNVGAFRDGRVVLVGEDNSVSDQTILVRAVWSDIKPDSHQYAEWYSNDGGTTWVRSFTAKLTRFKQSLPLTGAERDGPHDFDFEIGRWKVHNARLLHPFTGDTTWSEFEGTSVARPVWDGRADLVELESDPPGGHSEGLILRLYNPQSRQWSMTFANSRYGTLSQPAIGAFTNGRGVFHNQDILNGRTILARTVLSDVSPTSYRVEFAFSGDGGKTWEVNWISVHTRVGDSGRFPAVPAHQGASVTTQGNPVSNAVRELAREKGNNLLAAAEAMPADKYGFKPTPAQMTFGELIVHIQGDNRTTCAAIGGATPAVEAKLAPTDGKDKLVAALQRSLGFCDAALAPVTDATLGDVVSYYGHNASRAVAFIGLVTDWSDHYGQQAIYLRLNGVLPPTAH